MRILIETEFLQPVTLGMFEWVDVILPSGKVVTVFDDSVSVATREEYLNHEDGTKLWEEPE